MHWAGVSTSGEVWRNKYLLSRSIGLSLSSSSENETWPVVLTISVCNLVESSPEFSSKTLQLMKTYIFWLIRLVLIVYSRILSSEYKITFFPIHASVGPAKTFELMGVGGGGRGGLQPSQSNIYVKIRAMCWEFFRHLLEEWKSIAMNS